LGFLWHKWERKSKLQKRKKRNIGVSKHQHRVNLSTQLAYTPNNIMHFLGTRVTPSSLRRALTLSYLILFQWSPTIINLVTPQYYCQAWHYSTWTCWSFLMGCWVSTRLSCWFSLTYQSGLFWKPIKFITTCYWNFKNLTIYLDDIIDV
jgi:hypothetical protein